MPSFTERFLAAIDRWIGYDWTHNTATTDWEKDFYTSWGIKMAIVSRDGRIRTMGSSFWVVHRYDAKGNLISRIPMRKMLKEGDRIIYGKKKVYEAYRKQPQDEHHSFGIING